MFYYYHLYHPSLFLSLPRRRRKYLETLSTETETNLCADLVSLQNSWPTCLSHIHIQLLPLSFQYQRSKYKRSYQNVYFSFRRKLLTLLAVFFVSAVQLLTKNALFSSGSRRFDKLDANPQIWQRDGEGGGGGRKKNTFVLQTMASTQTITLLRYEWSA